jgi:hypothetical protein
VELARLFRDLPDDRAALSKLIAGVLAAFGIDQSANEGQRCPAATPAT